MTEDEFLAIMSDENFRDKPGEAHYSIPPSYPKHIGEPRHVAGISADGATQILDILLDRAPNNIKPVLTGEVMNHIQNIRGHNTNCFYTWILDKYGIEKQKANSYIYLYFSFFVNKMPYNLLDNTGVSPDKLILLAPVINIENIDYWIKTAKTVSLTDLKTKILHARMSLAL